MKPRIFLFATGLWHCAGGLIRGRGDTPGRAYADWFLTAHGYQTSKMLEENGMENPPRRCADCTHVKMSVGLQYWAPRCLHPDNSNITHHGGADCEIERGAYGNCGKEGRLFQEQITPEKVGALQRVKGWLNAHKS